ncbi:ATP-grasp fold amidoligase family protein [Caballeronia sp. GACF4]|uniref:ATP-grasp fold amidoligase family protein n=1 Tax=Caballeronia sp. GACF4 TaxID=2921763 RepID=UPI0020293357|nr:ATP-grasp fold amidoligase family protein [Caballeronia sp. GACF4]
MSLPRRLFNGAKGWLPDTAYLMLYHRHKVGRFPNVRAPETFNEKILYRCLFPDPRYADLADKLNVRDYVQRKVGKQYLTEIIATPERFTREEFDSLPISFVMKANHGSGFVKLVRDKAETSFEELDALAREWLITDFYRIARERHYRTIKPRIFFEELLLDSSGAVPADIKIHCFFNGRDSQPTIYIALISDRFGEHPRGDMYDGNWNRLDIAIGHYPRSEVAAPRPQCFDELISVAVSLAEGFEYVRVDLYAPDDRILFGELTFTPGAGVFPMHPDIVDYEWGRLMEVKGVG